MAEKKELIANLSPEDFTSNLGLIHGPVVVIYVGPDRTKFEVSKGLLCQASKFFDRAFNGSFMEGVAQEMDMIEDDPAAFEALVQYVYTGKVGNKNFQMEFEEMTFYLRFLVLADKADLLGPFPEVLEKLEPMLETSSILGTEHLELVFQLPADHEVREMVVRCCIPDYLCYIQGDGTSRRYDFEAAIDYIQGFAADLIKATPRPTKKAIFH